MDGPPLDVIYRQAILKALQYEISSNTTFQHIALADTLTEFIYVPFRGAPGWAGSNHRCL